MTERAHRYIVAAALLLLLVVPLQAAAFAALHFAVGFPNGALGYLMVFA